MLSLVVWKLWRPHRSRAKWALGLSHVSKARRRGTQQTTPPQLRWNGAPGDLPSGVRVAHNSGTSDVDDGVAHATNDIGLIPLPDGRRIAIAVFITDSTADQDAREQVIARIGKAAYEAGI
jgi:beta-lactamase class A